jgi:CRISPR-associated endonuclease Csn1
MSVVPSQKTILGLDLGATSAGWALVAAENGEPRKIIRAGVRIFDAGVDGNIESGREESRGKKRREARLQRRQTWRRARRARKAFRLLQEWGLLPPSDSSSPEERQALLTELDNSILKSVWYRTQSANAKLPEPEHVMPYFLRAAALDMPLEPFFLGRALYHLAQRRGFLSNRRQTATPKDKDKEAGVVKKGIGELREAMQASGARTLGEHFSKLKPTEHRIRTKYTQRGMFQGEFEKIWTAQAAHHPDLLMDPRKKAFHHAVFYQRPLRFPRNLVGCCELETKSPRAAKHLLISQKFRMLQALNNLRIVPPDGTGERELSADERNILLDRLQDGGDLTFADARKLPQFRKSKFNLEAGGEKRLPGNRTNAKFQELLGEKWKAMNPAEKNIAVEFVWSFEKQEKLADAAAKKWGIDPGSAQNLADVVLEADYLNVSRAAMEKLLPILEAGKSYAEARKELYPEKFEATEPLKELPYVQSWKKDLRNPAVARCLTEVRKVVNAIVRDHGKPSEIRIELARDLRNPKWLRQEMTERNRDQEKQREKAARKILEEIPGRTPSRQDILKVLLAEECRWECPYTGKPISMRALVGMEPQFDIEHILPFAKSLDNSFTNLTLCDAEHNRNVKQRRSPGEAYGADPDLYQAILDRVRKFTGPAAKEKLRRFLMTPEEMAEYLEGFEDRLLNDTRYATKLAGEYLGLLYGGTNDSEGKKRIFATNGQITAKLRAVWHLNGILNDGPTEDGGQKLKSRDDHRHHAVDALVTALADGGKIQMLSHAAERAPAERHRLYGSVEEPWPDFVDSVREEIARVVVSHRVSKKVRGALHQETYYSPPIQSQSKLDAKPKKNTIKQVHHTRKHLERLSANDLENIADPVVRALVMKKIGEFGGAEPKIVFSDAKNLPFLTAGDGRQISIKKVRVRDVARPVPVGKGRGARYVLPGENHHVEIYGELDHNGREIGWDASVVTLLEATRRKCAREPIVKKKHGPGTEFRFSLGPNEIIECDDQRRGGRGLFFVRGCTQEPRVLLSPVADAREKKFQEKDRAFFRSSPNTLRKLKAVKVRVTALGEIRDAHE